MAVEVSLILTSYSGWVRACCTPMLGFTLAVSCPHPRPCLSSGRCFHSSPLAFASVPACLLLPFGRLGTLPRLRFPCLPPGWLAGTCWLATLRLSPPAMVYSFRSDTSKLLYLLLAQYSLGYWLLKRQESGFIIKDKFHWFNSSVGIQEPAYCPYVADLSPAV